MCRKSETRFLRSMCEETDAMLIVFPGLNLLVGVYLDLWVREALQTYSNFRKMVNFYRFKQIGSRSLVIKLTINIRFIWVLVKTTSARADRARMVKWVILIP